MGEFYGGFWREMHFFKSIPTFYGGIIVKRLFLKEKPKNRAKTVRLTAKFTPIYNNQTKYH
jgi:hypothetical protein